MYSIFAILSSSRGFLAVSPVSFAASSSPSPCPFRLASDLNPFIVVSVVLPSPRLLIDVVTPPLLFSLFCSSLSRRFYLLISPVAVYLSCDVPTPALAFRIVRYSLPLRLRLRPCLRHLIIFLLLYRYLHCLYPRGLFGSHVAILASRSPPLGGTYCHKPRVPALGHPSKIVP